MIIVDSLSLLHKSSLAPAFPQELNFHRDPLYPPQANFLPLACVKLRLYLFCFLFYILNVSNYAGCLMPRQRVDPLHRQRVAQACDSCKRRKEKCNGALPCEQCNSRRRKDCCYTKLNRTLALAKDVRNERANSEVRVDLTEPDHIAPQVAGSHKQADSSLASSSHIFKTSRMILDSKGRPGKV